MNASEIISKHKDAILDRWIRKVKKEIPEAREHDLPIIKNDVPHLLDSLVESLKSDDARDVVYRSGSHGKERAQVTDYSLVQVMKEYRLLKETTFSVVDEYSDKIELRERDGIMYAIDQAMELATNVFYQERTHEIEDARGKAETLSRKLEEQGLFRDRFVASLTHDLRAPLNNTQQLVELLDEHLSNKEDKFLNSLISKIKLSIVRGNELINNLLDVNLIQSGEPLPIEREESDLLLAMRQSLESYQEKTRKRIKIHSDKDKIVGFWDTDALRRALDNMITNALKYGDYQTEIQLKFMQEANQTVISVHNFGNSIPSKQLGKLFDLYYRSQDAKGKTGWGLGLTLVKAVAEAHEGTVDVVSNPDDGTTFTLILPRYEP